MSELLLDSDDRTPSPDPDVCVIGTGVAGAMTAYRLVQRDYEVVMLEAGPRFDPSKRRRQLEQTLRPEGTQQEVWNMGGRRDRYTSSGELFYRLNNTRVKAVGGTTLHWLGMTSRLHEKDFEMNTRYGIARDWPISYEDLRPYYAEAEQEMGVAGAKDNPFAPPRENDYPMEAFPPSYADSLYAEACNELGITMHSAPQARNTEMYDNRSPCLSFDTCIPVCPSGAKYSADVHIRKAEEEGARIIDRVPVQYLEHGNNGDYIEAAVYETADGKEYRQTASQFVVAAGGIETPRLLLLSKSEQYPHGLANSSGAVGKYLMDHPVLTVRAELDEPTNQEPVRYPTSECHQFYDHEDPLPGSVKLTFNNARPPSPANLALRGGDQEGREDLTDPMASDLWGDEALQSMREHYPNQSLEILINVEVLPDKENTLTLDHNKTDNHGNPVPNLSWNIGSYARKTLEFGRNIAFDIMDELDAEIIDQGSLSDLPPASHPSGTTRMGNNPDESVVSPTLRTHDLQNLWIASSSVFTTAGAKPPTLTIAALALKAADHIEEHI